MAWGLLAGVIAVAVLAAVVVGVANHNHLATLRARCEHAWAQVEIQLRRRHDAISELLAVTQARAGGAGLDTGGVGRAREGAMRTSGVGPRGMAENALSEVVDAFLREAVTHDGLVSDPSFTVSRGEVADANDRIAYARGIFNDAVMSYNTARQQFPANVVAAVLGFEERVYFEVGAVAPAPVVPSDLRAARENA